MNGYLEQLSARSLGQLESPIRPRLTSRFESPLGAQSSGDANEEVSHESPAEATVRRDRAETVSPSRTDTTPVPARTTHDVRLPISSPQGGEPIVPANPDRAADRETPRGDAHAPPVVEVDARENRSLSQRLNQLDAQLAQLSGRGELPVAPRIASEDQPSHSIQPPTTVHNHHHHDTREIVQHTETIDRHTENTIEREKRGKPIIPNANRFESESRPERLVAPVVESARESKKPLRPKPDPPSVIERTIHSQSNVIVNQASQSNRSPAPNIVVQQQPTGSPSHTVTVTIGRIEVRAPKKEQPALPKPQRANPRIMSLDDYVQRRSRGAS